MRSVARSSHRTALVAAAVTAAAVVLPLVGPPVALAHPPETTALVSVSTQGVAGDDGSRLAAISGDGRERTSASAPASPECRSPSPSPASYAGSRLCAWPYLTRACGEYRTRSPTEFRNYPSPGSHQSHRGGCMASKYHHYEIVEPVAFDLACDTP